MKDNSPRDLGCLHQDTARGRFPRVAVPGCNSPPKVLRCGGSDWLSGLSQVIQNFSKPQVSLVFFWAAQVEASE